MPRHIVATLPQNGRHFPSRPLAEPLRLHSASQQLWPVNRLTPVVAQAFLSLSPALSSSPRFLAVLRGVVQGFSTASIEREPAAPAIRGPCSPAPIGRPRRASLRPPLFRLPRSGH